MIKDTYICRMVGGSAVIRMPLDTVGTSYKQTVGKGGVIYLRPVEDGTEEDIKNDLAVSELALATVGF